MVALNVTKLRRIKCIVLEPYTFPVLIKGILQFRFL